MRTRTCILNWDALPTAVFLTERSHTGPLDKDNALSYIRACRYNCRRKLKTQPCCVLLGQLEFCSGKPGSSPTVNIIPPGPCWSDKSITQTLASGERDNSV